MTLRLAWPCALVTAVAPSGKLTPEPANVTVTPGTGLPAASVTAATSGAAKAVFTGALWPPPAVARIAAGVVTRTLTVAVDAVQFWMYAAPWAELLPTVKNSSPTMTVAPSMDTLLPNSSWAAPSAAVISFC